MCGIAGIIKFNGESVRLDELRAMTDAMIHRGPDDDGFFHMGAVGIGMRRLSIIDVGGGHQPISNEDGTLWVVMNGEIYNYVELRQALKSRGHIFKTESDTEVILHLYEEKGVRALEDLNGMFAFALWDGVRQAMWVARDRLGIKPLYVYQTKDILAFASDMQAIRGIVRPQLSRDSIIKYLALAYAPSPNTFYQNIQKLPAACYLWVANGKVEQRVYWQIEQIATWQGTPQEAADQLESLLMDSIRIQLRSDVPLAVFLSGGIDSSAIVAMAAGLIDEPLRTLTINFSGKGGAEDVRFARLTAQRYKTRHREVVMDAAEAAYELIALLPLLDEPISDSALIPSYALSRIAREEGIKVVLNGAGADEMFGGYSRHWPARLGSPAWVAETFPRAVRNVISHVWRKYQPDRGRRSQDPEIAWGAGISGVSLDACWRLLRHPLDYSHLAGVFAEEFDGLVPAREEMGFSYGGMHTDLTTYLLDDVLSLSDKATMAASVEGRVPFLDHRLVEMAFNLPSSINLLGASPKGLLKQVLHSFLPAELLRRKKEGFSAPMHAWIQQSASFDLEHELGVGLVSVLDDLLNRKELLQILANPHRRHMASETLFSLFMLNRWCRVHGYE